MATISELHTAAVAADATFQAELVRVYGKRAGDARYQYRHNDAAVAAAAQAYREAAAALHEAFVASRAAA